MRFLTPQVCSKKSSAWYIVFRKKCRLWNIRSTRHNKRRGTRRDSLAFLTSFFMQLDPAIMKVVYTFLNLMAFFQCVFLAFLLVSSHPALVVIWSILNPRNNFGVNSFGWHKWPNKAKIAKLHSGYLRESELRPTHTRAHKVLPWNNAILLDEQWNKCSWSRRDFVTLPSLVFDR